MKRFIKQIQLKDPMLYINILTVSVLVFMPYYLFEGKLFIGGDDTRLMYVYPFEFLKSWSFFSWSNVSSLSYYNPSFHYLPFLAIWSVLDKVIVSKVVLNYFAFSLPLLLGFIYFQKLLNTFLGEKYRLEAYIGSLFFVLSPILTVSQYAVFLTSVWLVGLFPLVGYYFVQYIKTGRYYFVWVNMVWCVVLSIAMYTFAWIFGLLIPLAVAFLLSVMFFPKSETRLLLKKCISFAVPVFFSQLFWILPFSVSFFTLSGGNIGANVVSSAFTNTFAPTVLSTATGTIVYPLFNLFHRQIASDFRWPLLQIYKTFYDKVLFLNLLYPAVLFLGAFSGARVLKIEERKTYYLIFFAFIVGLFLFTVNVGPLKEFFLWAGYIPGFVMFRNFYDKFAPGYIFLYSFIFAYSLSIVNTRFPKYRKLLCATVLVVIFINTIPIRDIISGPLWQTKKMYRHVALPKEYIETTTYIARTIPSTTTILSLPFNEASYAVIMDEDMKHAYSGTSPIKILTGVSDVSGSLSFNPVLSGRLSEAMYKRDYEFIRMFLKEHNINYILVTKNIAKEILGGYFFDKEKLKYQDKSFMQAIAGEKIFESKNKNYALYKTQSTTKLFYPNKVSYRKISPVKYSLSFNDAAEKEVLIFFDSFHPGWKLYAQPYRGVESCQQKKIGGECTENQFFQLEDLLYFIKPEAEYAKPKPHSVFGNTWDVDLRKANDPTVIQTSEDTFSGSLTLFFYPQLFFYLGSILTTVTIIAVSAYTVAYKRND